MFVIRAFQNTEILAVQAPKDFLMLLYLESSKFASNHIKILYKTVQSFKPT